MYDDPGGDDYDIADYGDMSGSGILGGTLRIAGIVIAMGLGFAWMTGGLGSGETADSWSRAAQDELLPESGGRAPPMVQRATYASDEIVVPAGPRGHFMVILDVNGAPVRFLVDTGATTVTLTAEDAQRAGLPVHALDYTTRVLTANGEIGVAAVTLRDMQLGNLEVRDVEATVTQAQLSISLLGMSFLGRLSSFEVRPEGLILRY